MVDSESIWRGSHDNHRYFGKCGKDQYARARRGGLPASPKFPPPCRGPGLRQKVWPRKGRTVTPASATAAANDQVTASRSGRRVTIRPGTESQRRARRSHDHERLADRAKPRHQDDGYGEHRQNGRHKKIAPQIVGSRRRRLVAGRTRLSPRPWLAAARAAVAAACSCPASRFGDDEPALAVVLRPEVGHVQPIDGPGLVFNFAFNTSSYGEQNVLKPRRRSPARHGAGDFADQHAQALQARRLAEGKIERLRLQQLRHADCSHRRAAGTGSQNPVERTFARHDDRLEKLLIGAQGLGHRNGAAAGPLSASALSITAKKVASMPGNLASSAACAFAVCSSREISGWLPGNTRMLKAASPAARTARNTVMTIMTVALAALKRASLAKPLGFSLGRATACSCGLPLQCGWSQLVIPEAAPPEPARFADSPSFPHHTSETFNGKSW